MGILAKRIKWYLAPALFSWATLGIAIDYEDPVVLDLDSVMDTSEFDTALYQVGNDVHNDGFLNNYHVSSQFGEWEVSSTTLLKMRLREIVAMSKMREIEEGESSSGAIEDDVDKVKDGASNLMEDPGGAIKGAASGVSKLFKLSGEAWKSRDSRDDNQLTSLGKAVSGYDKAKREFAGQFGVDPYSSNEALHVELDRLATAAAQGSVFSMAFKALIPGGLGFAISATSMSQSLNEVLVTSSEVELRIINREKMLAMGVDPVVAEQYLDDKTSSPSYKTYLVGSLESMQGTGGREYFVEYAIGAPEEDVAVFRTSSAIMYARYHENVQAIDRFVKAGSLVIAMDSDGQAVIQAPLDHMLWTESLDLVLDQVDQSLADNQDASAKLIMLTGSVSDLARQQLEKRGWAVKSRVSL